MLSSHIEDESSTAPGVSHRTAAIEAAFCRMNWYCQSCPGNPSCSASRSAGGPTRRSASASSRASDAEARNVRTVTPDATCA